MVTTAQRIQNIPPRPAADEPLLDARERILRTAYELFRRHSTNTVGVDRIVAEAGVAKTTLYRHFRSKENLIVAVLARHDELWTRDWLGPEVARRADSPAGQLLAVFDAFADWFRQPSYPGCFFTNSMLEIHDHSNEVR